MPELSDLLQLIRDTARTDPSWRALMEWARRQRDAARDELEYATAEGRVCHLQGQLVVWRRLLEAEDEVVRDVKAHERG